MDKMDNACVYLMWLADHVTNACKIIGGWQVAQVVCHACVAMKEVLLHSAMRMMDNVHAELDGVESSVIVVCSYTRVLR